MTERINNLIAFSSKTNLSEGKPSPCEVSLQSTTRSSTHLYLRQEQTTSLHPPPSKRKKPNQTNKASWQYYIISHKRLHDLCNTNAITLLSTAQPTNASEMFMTEPSAAGILSIEFKSAGKMVECRRQTVSSSLSAPVLSREHAGAHTDACLQCPTRSHHWGPIYPAISSHRQSKHLARDTGESCCINRRTQTTIATWNYNA